MTSEKISQNGVRRYDCGKSYTPLTPEQRKIGVNKPDDPRAVRFHTRWFLPLAVIPLESDRVMPETRPDSEAYDHMEKRFGCRCEVCSRPQAKRWQDRWRRAQGLNP